MWARNFLAAFEGVADLTVTHSELYTLWTKASFNLRLHIENL